MAITTNVDTKQQERNIANEITDAKKGIARTIIGVKFTGFNGKEFAGMDSRQIPAFRSKVETYESNIEGIIDKINAQADIAVAFQGEEVKTAIKELLDAVKALLKRYVEHIKLEAQEVEDANARWLEAAKSVSGNITTDASDITDTAKGIQLD